MAARRVASSTNWTALGARMTGGKGREVFAAAKTATEAQMARIASAPAAKKDIDWDLYKRLLPGDPMVEEFQAKYEALEVPYPADSANLSAAADATDAALKVLGKDVAAEVATKCAGSQKDIAFFQGLPTARQMTYEMYLELFPNASSVVPKDRETMEAELAEAGAALDALKAKRG